MLTKKKLRTHSKFKQKANRCRKREKLPSLQESRNKLQNYVDMGRGQE